MSERPREVNWVPWSEWITVPSGWRLSMAIIEGKTGITDRLSDERPWGSYTVLGGGDGYQVKVIVVQPDKQLSLQRHARRSEHWFEVGGSGQVILDGQTRDVAVGAVVDVPSGMLHRVSNTGTEPLVFIEIQTGDYLGEDDIERIDDDFGRP